MIPGFSLLVFTAEKMYFAYVGERGSWMAFEQVVQIAASGFLGSDMEILYFIFVIHNKKLAL